MLKAFALALLASSSLAAAAPAPPAAEVACDLSLNVVDPDPRGLNVRAKPGGKVIARLAPTGEWIEVHVIGQSGDWLRIDRAEAIDDEAPEGIRQVFRGKGWVHVGGLGISELNVGEGTLLRAKPDDKSTIVRRVLLPEHEPKRTRVLGCRGPWLQVEADGLRAWTRTFCTNERTTCS